jgi:uncharacterized membrane protein
MSGLLSRPDRFFLAASLLFGVALAAVTPPFQVADEPSHFYRAYRVSEGRLALVPRAERAREELPSSVAEIGESLLGDLPFDAERKIAPETILAAFRVPLEPEKREPVFFPNTLQYTFVPYVPQALGILAGRLFEAPPLVLLYLARLSNLILGTLAVVFALRTLPALRWLAAMVALTPMAASLRASASADVTTTSAAFVIVAVAARLIWGPEKTASRRDLFLLTVGAVVLCASKAAYFPLALLVFLIPGCRRAGYLAVHTALWLATTVWAIATSRTVGILRFGAGIDSSRQIRDALSNPLDFLGIVAVDYVVNAPRYLTQFIGKLGWLDVWLGAPFLAAYLAVLLALLFLDAGRDVDVRPWQRVFLAALVLATMVLISASQYAIWTRYGADTIDGLQGRYYIPLALAAAWIFHTRRWADRIPPGRLAAALAGFTLVSFVVTLWALVGRYYG